MKVQAREERKEKGGGTVRTWTTRARRTTNVRNRPTDYFTLFQTTSRATYNLYGLRQQRPGTRRPSGLVKLLHNDNVALTQVCYYRCNATTAAPATTSMYDDKTWTMCWTKVKDVRGPSPRSRVLFISVRLAPQHDRNSGVKRRTAVATAREKTTMTTAAF